MSLMGLHEVELQCIRMDPHGARGGHSCPTVPYQG